MGRFGQHVYPALEPERPIGAADEFWLRGPQFRQGWVTRDGRGSVHGQIGTMLDQIQQYQVGARVGLPPCPVRAGPAEGPEPARPEQRPDFAGSVTTDRFSPKPRPTQNGAPRKLCRFCSSVSRSVRIRRTDSGDNT